MGFFARFNTVLSGCVGGCIGGLTVYALSYDRKEKNITLDALLKVPEVNSYEKWDNNWDKREPAMLIKPPKSNLSATQQNEYNEKLELYRPKATRNILLIRHGQYNLNGVTDKDRVLTTLGETQAFLTGNRLKDLNYPYTKIIQSTMTRATQTASFIIGNFPKVPVDSCSMIEEGAPIEPEPPISNWKPERNQFYQDGARIEAAFRKYIHRASPEQEKDSYEVIVCHGNVIRYFICRALQLPPNAWLRFSINHGSITWLVIRPSGRVTLRSFSDAGYMPPDAVTS